MHGRCGRRIFEIDCHLGTFHQVPNLNKLLGAQIAGEGREHPLGQVQGFAVPMGDDERRQLGNESVWRHQLPFPIAILKEQSSRG